jgi:ABC-2 type transport system ATP-binding protein
MSTHILSDVEQVCDEVAVIDNGHLLIQANRRELLGRYATPVFEMVFEPHEDLERLLPQLMDKISSQEWSKEGLTRDGTVLRVTPADVDAAKRELPALAAASGLVLSRYQSSQASLEDVFLRLTGSREPSPE